MYLYMLSMVEEQNKKKKNSFESFYLWQSNIITALTKWTRVNYLSAMFNGSNGQLSIEPFISR